MHVKEYGLLALLKYYSLTFSRWILNTSCISWWPGFFWLSVDMQTQRPVYGLTGL